MSLVRGDSGVRVRTLQISLKNLGFDPGPVDGEFGIRTEMAVKDFQIKNNLNPDGIFGQESENALYPKEQKKPIEASKAALSSRLVQLCTEDDGIRETDGKNRSPLIDQINSEIGADLGSPYCLAGIIVRGCMRLCKEFGLQLPKEMKTPGTQYFWATAPSKYKILPPAKAKLGTVGILKNRSNDGKGHAFLNITDEKKVQKTFEYNTNPEGSRDGDGGYYGARNSQGTPTKEYLGSVDVIQWILDSNNIKAV